MSYCVQCQWMLQDLATVDWTVHLLTTLLLQRFMSGGKVANVLVDACEICNIPAQMCLLKAVNVPCTHQHPYLPISSDGIQ